MLKHRPVGGRLQFYQDAWTQITNSKWILNIIQNGFRIPFTTAPPLCHTTSTLRFPTATTTQAQTSIENEIRSLLEKKAIEKTHGPGFRSHLFAVPKKTGDLRPVLNLKPLNQYIPRRPFKMETIQLVCKMIQPSDYLTSIDLRDAFLHVLIHSASRKYLQFHWKGDLFHFKTLAFGLSLSPMVFTKLLKPLLRWARRKGIRISAYLDDIIITAKTKELSHLHTTQVCQKLTELGFLFKESKSHLTPTQQLDHLGFTINNVFQLYFSI